MKKLMTSLIAGTLALSFAGAAVAAPTFEPQVPAVSGNIQNVDGKPWMHNGGGMRNGGGFDHRFQGQRFNQRADRHDGGYWNGHQGSREWRRGYRRHGDYWFPLAAFATGALITGAIVNNDNRVARGDAHVQWCYDHHPSYRDSDNTWKPTGRSRIECRSPY